jgi:hypothetical protein
MSPELGRWLFVITTVTIAFVTYTTFTNTIQRATSLRQSMLTSGVVMFAATVGIMGVAYAVQRGNPELSMTMLTHGSYAALIGDPFTMTPAALLIAAGWYAAREHLPHWVNAWWWRVIPFCIGLALGTAIHLQGGSSDSQSPYLSERLHDSATSWAHNVGVVPAVGAMLIFGLIPILAVRRTRWRYGLPVLLFVAMWMTLVVIDSNRIGFDPHWLDIEMYWSKWRPM